MHLHENFDLQRSLNYLLYIHHYKAKSNSHPCPQPFLPHCLKFHYCYTINHVYMQYDAKKTSYYFTTLYISETAAGHHDQQ